jgi:hypothetical protein
MPKTVISAQFRSFSGSLGYVRDIGDAISINSRFILPPDVPEAQAATILDAIGAVPLSAIVNGVCTEGVSGKPRKLQFLREDGSSMSVAVGQRSNLKTAANVIKGVLQSSGVQVSCIKLTGEYWSSLSEELGLVYNPGAVAPTHKAPSSSSKQHFYAGRMNYESDAVPSGSGQTNIFLLPVKSISDIKGSPSSQLVPVWNTCAGALSPVAACNSKSRKKRAHRRFLLEFVTEVNGTQIVATETAELPHAKSAAQEIFNCGQLAAALSGVFCIGYKGESYPAFHKVA